MTHSLTPDALLTRLAKLNVWRRGDERAPHKPLLLLHALARWSGGSVDAAHIQRKQARGPDVPANGIALCALHHRLFDRGAFTLGPVATGSGDDPLHVVVSEEATGGSGLETALRAFHHRPLEALPRPDERPAEQHLAWHRSQVFRATVRGGRRASESS